MELTVWRPFQFFWTIVFSQSLFTRSQQFGMQSLGDLYRQNCINCRNLGIPSIEEIKRITIIKNDILSRLHMPRPPDEITPPPRTHKVTDRIVYDNSTSKDNNAFEELSSIISFSEPSDIFSDENIIQFRLSKDTKGKELDVKSANILILVKYPKHLRQAEMQKRGKRRNRTVRLSVYSVDSNGQPYDKLTSIESQVRRTKWLKLSLPHNYIQNMVESEEKALRVYISCDGCGRGAELVLVHKRRRKRRRLAKGHDRQKSLNKRRPWLYLHTKIKTFRRNKRNIESCPRKARGGCCKMPFIVDFEAIGWSHWILAPKRYRTAFCQGNCAGALHDEIHLQNTPSNASTNALDDKFRNITCQPVKTKPLHLLYFNDEGQVLTGVLLDMIVTRCGCR
ncbi:hypothetical protein ACJMK2_023257 [Sinanodonta woodiana]|uniref:TGF-beta family profile domain-containing protein n=1 Tax=Sinanodonta woodiana TaxID=1069815 RepID=A0ABD3T3M9_SINWO